MIYTHYVFYVLLLQNIEKQWLYITSLDSNMPSVKHCMKSKPFNDYHDRLISHPV